MEGALSVREYLIDMGSDMDDKASGRTPTDDQLFLLYFIMGTYFGPDLKEQPPKSVFQRRAEGLPPYTTENLSSTHMKMIELERVYYYILRKADQSVIVKLPWLQQFLHGNLSTSKKTVTLPFPQFDDLFPPDKHPHSLFKGQYDAINNIVFISDPNVLYIGQEYLEKFKRLTKLEDLILDRNDAMHHTTVDGKVLYNINVQEIEYHKELRPSSSSGREEDTNDATNGVPYCDTPPIRSECVINNGALALCGPDDYVSNGMKTSDLAELGSDMIFLPSHPTKEEWINVLNATKSGCALTGTATMGQIGPSIGNIDIGESEDSYIFRVSLPGVKRDEREFSCEVEDDGKVSIRGVTVTGEKTVCRFDQVFEMQSQKLCPQGHFSVSFKLPGPVDPQQFSGNFGTDGILEGIVMKARRRAKR